MSKQNQTLIEALRSLLAEGTVSTHETLRKKLEQLGFLVNQSKISRLLHKIGAVKTIGNQGEIVYQIPWEPEPPKRGSTLEHLVLDITQNEILIVVRTSPGAASMIARMLDHSAEQIGSLGTVAGDDTIFVVPRSIKTIEVTLKEVKHLLIDL